MLLLMMMTAICLAVHNDGVLSKATRCHIAWRRSHASPTPPMLMNAANAPTVASCTHMFSSSTALPSIALLMLMLVVCAKLTALLLRGDQQRTTLLTVFAFAALDPGSTQVCGLWFGLCLGCSSCTQGGAHGSRLFVWQFASLIECVCVLFVVWCSATHKALFCSLLWFHMLCHVSRISTLGKHHAIWLLSSSFCNTGQLMVMVAVFLGAFGRLVAKGGQLLHHDLMVVLLPSAGLGLCTMCVGLLLWGQITLLHPAW